MEWFITLNPIVQALIATIFTWAVTALGALTVCFFKKPNTKILCIILGISAGVMLAAAFWSLIVPAIELSEELGYIKWLLPTIGFVLGGIFVLISDRFLDKVLQDKQLGNGKSSLKRSILTTVAITIHNIPEGMSIGVAFGGVAAEVPGVTIIGAIMLALGIGIQNFPEGAAVSLPVRRDGLSRWKSFMIGQASALVEPISAIVGALLVIKVRSIMPLLLAFASGAMILVVARELFPEAMNENKNLATVGTILGFILMMILDVALG